ncbi:MAG: hypothetical protein KKH40_07690 [Nanoarchaeota archaeon]|nr:hypothetical protein [Nanoarchaeota archaeon]
MTGYELSERTKKAIRELKLTPIESLFEKNPLGILYTNNDCLEYYDWENESRLAIKKMSTFINALYCDDNQRIIINDQNIMVYDLLNDEDRYIRMYRPNCITTHKNNILDCGDYGIFGVGDTMLWSKRSLGEKNLAGVEAIQSYNDELYALVNDKNDVRSIIELKVRTTRNCKIKNVLMQYDARGVGPYNFIILPYGKIKDLRRKTHPFSILSCVNNHYLDLNGEKIAGTDTEHQINCLQIKNIDKSSVKVFYSVFNQKAIFESSIDLDRKSADTKVVVSGLDKRVCYFQLINNEKSHEYLSSLGKVIR